MEMEEMFVVGPVQHCSGDWQGRAWHRLRLVQCWVQCGSESITVSSESGGGVCAVLGAALFRWQRELNASRSVPSPAGGRNERDNLQSTKVMVLCGVLAGDTLCEDTDLQKREKSSSNQSKRVNLSARCLKVYVALQEIWLVFPSLYCEVLRFLGVDAPPPPPPPPPHLFFMFCSACKFPRQEFEDSKCDVPHDLCCFAVSKKFNNKKAQVFVASYSAASIWIWNAAR